MNRTAGIKALRYLRPTVLAIIAIFAFLFSFSADTRAAGDEVTRVGYTLIGFSASIDGSAPVYSADIVLDTAHADEIFDGNTTRDSTLYAVWEKKTYEIYFSPNGGTGTAAPQTASIGDSVLLPDHFSREGYILSGFSAVSAAGAASYSGPYFFLNESAIIDIFADDTVVVRTLYAIWRLDEGGGASPSPSPSPDPDPDPDPDASPSPSQSQSPDPSPEPSADPSPDPSPSLSPDPEQSPDPSADPEPETTLAPTADSEYNPGSETEQGQSFIIDPGFGAIRDTPPYSGTASSPFPWDAGDDFIDDNGSAPSPPLTTADPAAPESITTPDQETAPDPEPAPAPAPDIFADSEQYTEAAPGAVGRGTTRTYSSYFGPPGDERRQILEMLEAEGVPFIIIGDGETPLFGFVPPDIPVYGLPGMQTWALSNLIFCVVGAVMALIKSLRALAFYVKRRKWREEEYGEIDEEDWERIRRPKRCRLVWLVITDVIAAAGIVLFLIVAGTGLIMTLIDIWTTVFAVMLSAVSIAKSFVFSKKEKAPQYGE